MGADRSESVNITISPNELQNAITNGIALAAIAWIVDHSDFGRVLGNVLNEFGGIVGGPIVDDDDFRIPCIGTDAGDDRFKGCRDPRTLVKCGNHDAVFGILRHDSPSLCGSTESFKEDKGHDIAEKDSGLRQGPESQLSAI